MEIVEGCATHVKSSLIVRGGEHSWTDDLGESHGSVSVTHLARFQLGSRTVEVSSRELVAIGEGDRVLLAGAARRGMFEALAYRNLSRFGRGDRGWFPELAAGIICAVIGSSVLLLCMRAAQLNPFALLIGAPIALAGVYVACRALRVRLAVGALQRHA